MNDSNQSEMKSNDEPLFVLKYDGFKIAPRAILCAFVGLAFSAAPFGFAMKHELGFEFFFVTIFASLVVVGTLFYIIQGVAIFCHERFE